MAAAERRVGPPPPFEIFVERYLKDPRVLVCPSVVSEFDADYWPVANVPDARDMSYCYVNGLSTKDAHDYIVAFDGEWDHALGQEKEGVNVLYTGGHVEWKPDLDRFQVETTAQLLEMQRRRRRPAGSSTPLLRRPWWSRYPEPPAFKAPPREAESALSSRTRGASALSLAIGAALALAGVYVLRRIAR